jgi:hypothetical protein
LYCEMEGVHSNWAYSRPPYEMHTATKQDLTRLSTQNKEISDYQAVN